MKTVIQRNLPLNQKYKLLHVVHGSVEDGIAGSCCNCGRLITQIATIKSDNGGVYEVGLDCLDTLLENNTLLDNESYFEYQWSAKPAIQKAKSTRAKILKNQKKNDTFRAKLVTFNDGKFGFSYTATERGRENSPQGFDYTFNPAYKELTLSILKGLYYEDNSNS